MKSRNRFALSLWLALAASTCLTTPSLAQSAARADAKITELSKAGKYSEAVPLAQKTLADMEKTHGPVHRDVAAALNNLGMLYGSTGQEAEAEPLYKRALTIFEKAGGLDSVEVAPTLNNLAALYQRQERFADAEPLFRRALAIRERSLGPSIPISGNR